MKNPMKSRTRYRRLLLELRHSTLYQVVTKKYLALILLAIAFACSGCEGRRISKANVDEVTDGMSPKQVESILGPPTSIDNVDLPVTKKLTYTYKQGDESVTIVFLNDEVKSKESNLRK